MHSDFDALFEASEDFIGVTGPDGTLERVNPAFARGLGSAPAALRGRPLLDLIHPDDRKGAARALGELRAGMPVVGFEGRCQARDGSVRFVNWAAHAERDPERIYVVGRDVTAAHQQEGRFRDALEVSPMPMVLVDAEGLIRLANSRAEAVFGYGPGELLHRSVEDLVPGAVREMHRIHRQRFGEAPAARPMGMGRDLTAQRRDGTTFPAEIGLSPLQTPFGPMVLSAVVDLTERRQAERVLTEQAQQLAETNTKLVELATKDGLTGMWNRRSFLDQLAVQLELAVRTTRPVSVLMLDVDHFKEYNDRFGHLAGDEILRGVAAVMHLVARRSDYVARIGGEEFAVILPETNREGSQRLGERFRMAIDAATWPLRHVTASVGAATAFFPRLGDRIDTPAWRSRLLTEADRALYHSKLLGRNRVTHARELEETDASAAPG